MPDTAQALINAVLVDRMISREQRLAEGLLNDFLGLIYLVSTGFGGGKPKSLNSRLGTLHSSSNMCCPVWQP